MILDLPLQLRRKGFVGPRYEGMRGKLRFLLESIVWRREIVFAATPESFRAVPHPGGPALEFHLARRFDDLERFRSDLDAEYYPGYIEAWRGPFTWGEQAVVGTLGSRAACFAWMQFGTAEGYSTYYGRLLEREARVLRVGVAPSFRRGGVNKRLNHHLLERLFGSGHTRVYIECYRNNLPSVRTFLRVGYLPLGELSVVSIPPLRGFVRWSPVDASVVGRGL